MTVDYAPAQSLFEDYVRRTDRYWPPAPGGGDHRQVRKLRLSLQGATQDKLLDTDAAIEWIASLALARAVDRPPPLYVMGLGGSGSQWLAEMLAELLPAFYATEVYLPPALVEAMADMPPKARGYLVDCLHLAHLYVSPVETGKLSAHPQAGLSDEALIHASAVNAASGVIDPQHREWDPRCFVVYLLRDPRDQVLSVTFRKPGYRHEVAHTESDEEYLLRNAARAARSYIAWRDSPLGADFVCRYEALRNDTVDMLERILTLHGRMVERERIAAVARDHDAGLMQSGVVSPRGNLYTDGDQGSQAEPGEGDRLRALLHSELVEIRTEAGYPPSECLGKAIRLSPGTSGERRIRFTEGEDLGLLLLRSDEDAETAFWRELGPARGEVVVPACTSVKLRVSQAASGPSIESLRTLSAGALDSLCLAGSRGLDDGLLGVIASSLTQLRELDLSRTGVSDAGALHLEALPHLKGVSLLGTGVSPQRAQRLCSETPGLMVLA